MNSSKIQKATTFDGGGGNFIINVDSKGAHIDRADAEAVQGDATVAATTVRFKNNRLKFSFSEPLF